MEHTILCPRCLSRTQQEKKECPFCGQSFGNTNPPGVLPFASLLDDHYTIASHLSTDGEGVLYSAIENTGKTRVMVKEYFPVTISKGRDASNCILPQDGKEVIFKTNRMDFAELYQNIMRITPTTGLAAVLDVFETNNTVYAVLEQVEGETLQHYLATHDHCFAAAEARSLLQPIMEGVASLHKVGIIHRGVSPSNIILTTGGTARLCGYGTLDLRTEGGSLKCQLYPGFSAPEQYNASEFEGRYTDVYGIAALCYRMMTGQTPLAAPQRRIKDTLPAAKQVDAAIPGYVSDVLETAMNVQAENRIQNVPELMSALNSQRAADTITKRKTLGESISAKSLFGGSLIVILALFLLLMWSFLGRDKTPTEADSEPESTSQSQSEELTQPVTIPDVKGLTYSQLQSDANYSANYRFVISAQEYSSDFAAGVIIDQSPEAKITVNEQNPLIELVISKGPELVEMPQIEGFTRQAAEQELASKNIKASFLMMENNGDYASDCVVNTSVEAGTLIDVNKVTVNVYIAKERQVALVPTPTPSPSPTPEPTQAPPNPEEPTE